MVVSLSTREASTVGFVENESLGLEFWAADLGSSKSGAATDNNREWGLGWRLKGVVVELAEGVSKGWLNSALLVEVLQRKPEVHPGPYIWVQGKGAGSQLSAFIGDPDGRGKHQEVVQET